MSMTWSLTPSENWATSDDTSSHWVPLPRDFPQPGFADLEAYVGFVASELTTPYVVKDYRGSKGLRPSVAQTVRDAYAHFVGKLPAHLHFLYWPDISKPPLPVFVGLWKAEHDRESAIQHYSGAVAEDAVEPPIVELFATDHLGDGMRVLRYDRLDDATQGDDEGEALQATLAYAWRSDEYETDVQVWTTTPNLGQLFSALTDLDAFARSIVPTPDPGT